ncbi:MAG: hypothetical protein FJ100_19580 [Deltaproteobacteria bacterium]|nr:hypothetical protein [Deltaproteobacteria bacterium]
MSQPAAALRWVLFVAAVVALTDCSAASKRRFFATCGEAADCETELCSQGLCTKSCTPGDECGGGVCVQKICKPIERVECTADVDCEKASPSNGCRSAVCAGGKCAFAAPLAGVLCGTKCEAGTWIPGQCSQGQCIAAKGTAPVDCNDSNACTEDTCGATTGCVHAHRTATCDDGDACTINDTCANGECKGSAGSCDDAKPCTLDSCQKATGCLNSNVTSPCDDGNACTQGDVCSGGLCAGTATNCDDKVACTADSCDAGKGGCQHQPLDAPCATTNPCAVGACNLTKGCTSIAAANGAPCTKADPCTVASACQAGLCTATVPKKCDDGNPCTIDSCDSVKGCTADPAPTGNCDDGNPCTTGDNCQGGLCSAKGAAACNDTNPCTDDKCEPSKGCVNAPSTAACDDGDPCSSNDSCSGGTCAGTKALWKSKATVNSPYQAEGVAYAGTEFAIVGSVEIDADNVKRHVSAMDMNGSPKWQIPANASGIERPNGITALSSMWYVCGEVKSSAAALAQGFVRQHGANGGIGWAKAVQSGTNPVTLRGIAASGSTLSAIGRVGELGTGKTIVARYSNGGAELGNAEHAIADSSEGFGIAGYPPGQGFAFGGRATKGGDSKAIVGRLTEGGQIQWTLGLTEGSASFAEFHAVTLVGSDIVAAGEVVFPGAQPKLYVARVDSGGSKMWAKVFTLFSSSHSGGVVAYANWVVVATWGNIDGEDVGLLLLDGQGNEHNVSKVAAPGDQRLFGLASAGSGTFIVHGTTSDVGQPVDILLARVNAYFETACAGSLCAQVKDSLCDDADPCTQDSCTPSQGCGFKPFADGTPCATGKVCKTGACVL